MLKDVNVWGMLRQDKWQDKSTGDNRSKHVIRVEEFEITDSYKKNDVENVENEEKVEVETAPF